MLRVSVEALLLSMMLPHGNSVGMPDSTTDVLKCPPLSDLREEDSLTYIARRDSHALD